MDFSEAFRLLTHNEPFPWQSRLYDHFTGDRFPKTASLPTGLGKTSIIAVWLIALANYPDRIPRRLVYVVNRRTVVDQTTDEVQNYRNQLQGDPALSRMTSSLSALCSADLGGKSPLAISTLRGQFADNREWSVDPARPAVICGTVDMIGSRLLFSGYGIGWKSKPLHAGFLAQDTLLIHDESHLEQPFQNLLESIENEQRLGEQSGELPWRKLRVLELTATPRSSGNGAHETPFVLTPADLQNTIVRQRVHAAKGLTLTPLKDAKKSGAELAEVAQQHRDSGAAILIYARAVEDVTTVRTHLLKKGVCEDSMALLTGTMRGLERDELVTKPVFGRFLNSTVPAGNTVYLISTSAGEVGVNITSDHLICDLTPFDSMAQRFGRLNRFGTRDDATITVLHPATFEANQFDDRRERTLRLLQNLDGDASPHALASLDAGERTAAFTPTPTILPATEILYDTWALTSIRDRLPGRPPVEPFLHGLADWDPPETQVAWREEVCIVRGSLLESHPASDLLDLFPILPHEVLKDRSDRVFDRLKKLKKAIALPDAPVWIVSDDGLVETNWTIATLIVEDKSVIEGKLILLPPELGGLNGVGMLDPDADSEKSLDVGDVRDERVRRWEDSDGNNSGDLDGPERSNEGLHLIYGIDTRPDSDESEEPLVGRRYWNWYKKSQEGERTTARKLPVLWSVHVADVVAQARNIVGKLPLTDELRTSVILAAEFHDHGKRRRVFQNLLGNPNPETLWAKSGGRWSPVAEDYRHELGSLIDLNEPDERDRCQYSDPLARYNALSTEMQHLVLHLIATHHGWARPHFAANHALDPERSGAETVVAETPRRFARLQRRFGRWGLAYLESLLRAADWAASANPSEYVEVEV